jgi:acyl-CoA dehydrogenase
MDLVLSEDQELLAKIAADFVKEKSPVARFRDLRDHNDATGFSRELWKEMAALGWVGIPFDEAHGGAGLGLAELVVVLEELGRTLAPEPFLSTVLLGGQALALGGNEALATEWLPKVAAGDALVTVAQQEARSRYQLTRVETRAEAGANGLAVTRQTRLDHRGAALVRLDGVEVDSAALVGAKGAGGALLTDVVDRATVGLCAEMLGGMQQAFDLTLEHLKSRKQFDALIGSFQALKHRAADVFIAIELSKSVVMAAARAIDEGSEEAPKLVSLAKAQCTEAYLLATDEGVQMFGGVGMTDEYDIGLYMKRARAAELSFGDAAFHRDRWARLSSY